MRSRSTFKTALKNYFTSNFFERSFVPQFLDLLEHTDAYKRSLTKGHITASAWVLSPSRKEALMIHHKKLDRWLQPGGHADGEEDLIAVAEKELIEETGLSKFWPYAENIFDLDIHTIPKRNDVPAHEHFDVRFLFISKEDANLKANEEVKAVRWVPLNAVPKEQSLQRMAKKCSVLFSS